MVLDVGEEVRQNVSPHGQLFLEKVLIFGNVTNVIHIEFLVMQ